MTKAAKAARPKCEMYRLSVAPAALVQMADLVPAQRTALAAFSGC